MQCYPTGVGAACLPPHLATNMGYLSALNVIISFLVYIDKALFIFIRFNSTLFLTVDNRIKLNHQDQEVRVP